MRVIVCGSRWWKRSSPIVKRLNELPRDQLVIVHGDQRGADKIAGSWAKRKKVPVEPFPAKWGSQGKAAGPIRNQKMLDAGADLVLAFRVYGPSPGTDDMVSRAEKAGVPVEVVCEPD